MKIHQISWNLYAQDNKIINKPQLDKLLMLLEPKTDIIIFSFQEINDIKHIKKELRNHELLKDYKLYTIDTTKSTIYNRKFNIGLFLLISNHINHIQITNKISICITRQGNKGGISKLVCTKGIVGFKLLDKNTNDTYLFMGCHLPVFNSNNTKSALNVINKTIEKYANDTTKIIIGGDFNSRLPISSSITRKLSKFYTKKSKAIENSLTNRSRVSRHRSMKKKMIHENMKMNKITNNIMDIDKLNNNFSKILKKHLKESKIKFLPTYKFDPDTGIFKKNYRKESKYPGYADRIFHANLKPIKNSYQSMHVIGSDHMPISMTFK